MSPRAALVLSALLLAGCSEEEKITPVPQLRAYTGTLAVDIRGAAAVAIAIEPDGAVAVTVQPDMTGAQDLLDPSTKLSAPGTVEAFPEAQGELYTAKFSAPARAGSPCGDEAISLALSLFRRGKGDHVGGSLTAYCGMDRFHGVPARVLRLSGDLPKSGPAR